MKGTLLFTGTTTDAFKREVEFIDGETNYLVSLKLPRLSLLYQQM